MSSCKRFEDMIENYIDNELTTEEKELMNVHLGACSSCREKLAFAKALRIKIKECEMPGLPEDFLSRVNAAIDSEEVTYSKAKSIRRIFNWRATQGVAACLLIAAFLGINNNVTDNINKLEEDDFKPVPTQGMVQGELSGAPVPTAESTPAVEEKKTDEVKKTAEPVKKVIPQETEQPATIAAEMTIPSVKFEKYKAQESAMAIIENEPEAATFILEDEEEISAYSGEDSAAASEGTEETVYDYSAENITDAKNKEIDIPARARAGLPGGAGAVSGGGSGGGSSAVTAEPESIEIEIDGKLIVPKEMIDKVRGIAMKYGGCSDWNYSMTQENYKEFLAELETLEIAYNADFEASEIVIFKIEY